MDSSHINAVLNIRQNVNINLKYSTLNTAQLKSHSISDTWKVYITDGLAMYDFVNENMFWIQVFLRIQHNCKVQNIDNFQS